MTTSGERHKRADLAALTLLGVLGFWQLAPGLAHPMIVSWDEGAHQAVTRGIHDTWLPVIYRDPLVPIDDGDWFSAGVFLHKPTLPFFLGALFMRLTGVTPLALRLVSLFSEIAAALVVFLLARRDLGRGIALILGMGFLLLPFGWQLVQGVQFGDATDCTLTGLLALSFCFLVRAVERDSSRSALLAGGACGLAYLCKSALALVPIGAALVLALTQDLGIAKGIRWRNFALLLVAGVAVGAPWNIYCALRWPKLYALESHTTLAHLTTGVGRWDKPIDALFNQIGSTELSAVPMVFFLISGLWVVRVAWIERSATAIVAALWLWGEWLPLSYAKAKVPATMWGAIPAMLLAAGYLLRDGITSPPLALTTLGGLISPWAMKAWPALSGIRMLVPSQLPQTRTMSGLAEGVALAAIGMLLGAVVQRAYRKRWQLPGHLAVTVAAGLLVIFNGRALAETRLREQARFSVSYTDVLGRVLDTHIPERSILFRGFVRDPPCCAETQNLMFWSGRMVYPAKRDLLLLARERGYHPYLISPAAEPFERVRDVPAGSWLQAFDLERPISSPMPLPEDALLPTDATNGNVLAVGVGSTDEGRGRYAVYIQSGGGIPSTATFVTPGNEVPASLVVSDSLIGPDRLVSGRWLEVPLNGPPPEDVRSIRIGDATFKLH